MSAAFLHGDLVAAVGADSANSTAPVSTMPLSNLVDPQPRLRTRWGAATVAIQVDFGSAQTISAVALISTTLASAATIRVRLSNNSNMSSPTWDSGTATADTSSRANGNVVVLHATSASGRYLRVDLVQSGSSVIDVGRLVAGPLWRLAHAWSYGIAEGRQVLDRRDRNSYTGAEFPVPAVANPRTTGFSLPYITGAEAIGEFRTMLATLGAAGDALWIPSDSLSRTELNNRCIWGAIAQPGDAATAARSNYLQYQRNFTITERL